MCNSCKSVFPNTCAWEQEEWNKTKKQNKKVIREVWVWEEDTNKNYSWSPITTKSKYNNNNNILFYKTWKKYNKIQITKKKMDFLKIWNEKSTTFSISYTALVYDIGRRWCNHCLGGVSGSALACGACNWCHGPGFKSYVKQGSRFKKSQTAVSITGKYTLIVGSIWNKKIVNISI